MPTPQEETMLADLEDCDAEMTEWEKDFLTSIRSQLDSGPHSRLTDKQYDVLEKLWERYAND